MSFPSGFEPSGLVQILPAKFVINMEILRFACGCKPNRSGILPFRQVIDSFLEPNQANNSNKGHGSNKVPLWQMIRCLKQQACDQDGCACRRQKQVAISYWVGER